MNIRIGKSAVKMAIIVTVVSFLAAFGLIDNRQKTSASAEGPSASHTDAPGEDNCTACHSSFEVNSGGGSVTITGIPHDYQPGQQIPVTVTTSQEDGAVVFGFQMTAIDSQGRQAGNFTPVNPAQAKTIFGDVGPNQRQYVEHTTQGIIPTQGGTKSWNITWTAPSPRVGKVRFYAAGNAANSDNTTSGDNIYTKATASLSGSAISNFNGDLFSDIAVFRPSTGIWYTFSIATNTYGAYIFGQAGDRITPGDYDGDGTTDFSVWRASTQTWYIQRSTQGFNALLYGSPGDQPVQADYDGDNKTDVAVFRSPDQWYLLQSNAGFILRNWGVAGDKPVPGDYDGDGKTDLAVFRPSNGTWYISNSGGGSVTFPFGISEDKPVPADYDGDGKTDIAVFRPSTGVWWVARSGAGTFTATTWGFGTDTPAPADYDSDGKADIAVYRASTGIWYLFRSADSSFYAAHFGISEDIPVPTAYIPQ